MRELTRILCVEDEPDIRTVLELALGVVGGYELSVCESGRHALERFSEFQPDLVLLDVMMPGMDGPETLSALRDLPEARHTPVIFLTAKAQGQEVARFLDMGAAGVIRKPFDPMTLHEEVRRLWNALDS